MKFKQVLFLIALFCFICFNAVGQSFNAMSYNIRYDNLNDGENRWDKRKLSMIEMIEEYHPEILGIQEGLFHQVQYLDSSLSTYKYIGIGRDDGINKGEFSAIFYDTTMFGLLSTSTIWLSQTPDMISVGWDASMERICTYGHFLHKESKREIWVFNTHFDHLGPIARVNSAKLILKTIKRNKIKKLPIILMGDFNSLPESKPIKILNRQLSDSYLLAQNPLGPVGTFNGFNPENPVERRIDYIFLSGFKVVSFQQISDKRKDNFFISDHLPVFVKLSTDSRVQKKDLKSTEDLR